MNLVEDKIVHLLTGKPNLSQVTVDELLAITDEQPFFSVAQLLLTQKMKQVNHPGFTHQLQKTALFFPNTFWLDQHLQAQPASTNQFEPQNTFTAPPAEPVVEKPAYTPPVEPYKAPVSEPVPVAEPKPVQEVKPALSVNDAYAAYLPQQSFTPGSTETPAEPAHTPAAYTPAEYVPKDNIAPSTTPTPVAEEPAKVYEPWYTNPAYQQPQDATPVQEAPQAYEPAQEFKATPSVNDSYAAYMPQQNYTPAVEEPAKAEPQLPVIAASNDTIEPVAATVTPVAQELAPTVEATPVVEEPQPSIPVQQAADNTAYPSAYTPSDAYTPPAEYTPPAAYTPSDNYTPADSYVPADNYVPADSFVPAAQNTADSGSTVVELAEAAAAAEEDAVVNNEAAFQKLLAQAQEATATEQEATPVITDELPVTEAAIAPEAEAPAQTAAEQPDEITVEEVTITEEHPDTQMEADVKNDADETASPETSGATPEQATATNHSYRLSRPPVIEVAEDTAQGTIPDAETAAPELPMSIVEIAEAASTTEAEAQPEENDADEKTAEEQAKEEILAIQQSFDDAGIVEVTANTGHDYDVLPPLDDNTDGPEIITPEDTKNSGGEASRLSEMLSSQAAAFKKPMDKKASLPFGLEPYMIDYFASQGINLEEVLEASADDSLGKKVRKFTDWLKQMRRLSPHPADLGTDKAQEQEVQGIAALSIEAREILTESMADVLVKQGKIDKAIQLYSKLSFLNPAKTAYFAAKIIETSKLGGKGATA